MGVDDFCERRLVSLGTDIGVSGPDKLLTRYCLAGGGHAAEAKVGRICQDRSQQRVVVFASLSCPQVGTVGGGGTGLVRAAS